MKNYFSLVDELTSKQVDEFVVVVDEFCNRGSTV